MTNRTMYKRQFQGTYEDGVTTVFAKAVIGASGAVASYKGLGVRTITKSVADGTYVVTLDRRYNALLSAHVTEIAATPTGASFGVTADAIAASGALTLVSNVAGTEANPASATVLLIEIKLKDSTVVQGLP